MLMDQEPADILRRPKSRYISWGNPPSPHEILTGSAYKAEVARYLRDRHTLTYGKSDVIPTIHGPVEYTRRSDYGDYYTDRTLETYYGEVFGDEYTCVKDEKSGRYIGIPRENPHPIAGGIHGALSGRRVIVDIGSGQGYADHQIAQENKEATVLGIDSGYGREVQFDVTKPGVQLSRGDWRRIPVPDGTVGTVLAVSSFSTRDEESPADEERNNEEFLREVTRVTRPGVGIFRCTSPDSVMREESMKKILKELGWNVFFTPDII